MDGHLSAKEELRRLLDRRAGPLAARVCHELRALVRSLGEPIDDGWIIPCDLRHRDIAALVGCSRPNVSRVLKALRDAGRIGRVGGRFFVSNALLVPTVARRPPQNPPGVDPSAARSRAGSRACGRETRGHPRRRGRRS
jgi:hypothetical protein